MKKPYLLSFLFGFLFNLFLVFVPYFFDSAVVMKQYASANSIGGIIIVSLPYLATNLILFTLIIHWLVPIKNLTKEQRASFYFLNVFGFYLVVGLLMYATYKTISGWSLF